MTSLNPSPGLLYRSVEYLSVKKLDCVKMVPISDLVDLQDKSACGEKNQRLIFILITD